MSTLTVWGCAQVYSVRYSLNYLSLLACSEQWMGSLLRLVSLEQAIRTPRPWEIIPYFTGTRLSVVHISALSFSFFISQRSERSQRMYLTQGGGGRCSFMWMKARAKRKWSTRQRIQRHPHRVLWITEHTDGARVKHQTDNKPWEILCHVFN